MSGAKREHIPVTPTILLTFGIVVGIVGLAMLLLGIGGTAPTTLQVPGINVNVSTTSLALAVTVLGFGVAVTVLIVAIGYARLQQAERRKLALKLAKERHDLTPTQIKELLDATDAPLVLHQTVLTNNGLEDLVQKELERLKELHGRE
jgi:hypothetical protein